MEPETRYTIVGAVVVALLTATIGFVIWLSAAGAASETRFYTIRFEKQSLEGLQVGGDVNMRGIKVGRVEDYAIERENINEVNVTIRIQRRTPVSENTTAQVARNIVTGLARIDLNTPGVPGPELNEVPPGERFPVIPEGQSELQQITESANKLATSADSALNRVNALLSPRTLESFQATLVSLRDFTAGLNARLERVDEATTALIGAANSLQRTSDQVGESVQGLAASTEAIAGRTNAVMRDARVAVRRYAALADTLDSQARTLGGSTQDAIDVGLRELLATMRELRRAADGIATAARRLEDPRSAIFGPRPQQLGPGETPR